MSTHPRTPTTHLPPERAHDILRHARVNPLDALFSPKTVAVIGATEKAGSVGCAVLKNLGAFDGRVYPVNPKRAAVFDIQAFPNIAAIPEKVDLAVIATPAATLPGIILECAKAGVPAAIIISAGFKECGKAGAELEHQVLAEARRGKIRLLGPNCLGLMVPRGRLNATFADGMAEPGTVAFLSQSGALCTAILDWSFREKVGFSAFVSVGSMLDVGWGDLITYFGDDPHTKSIVCYMESVGDARSFLSAAREVARVKPIILLKVGRTDAAAKAAASHTGALTGSDAVLDAAFRRAGVLRVNTVGELFNMAELLAKQPRPDGPNLAIVTNAGGPGALATDAVVASNGQLAELEPSTLQALNQFLPPHWSHGNPIDILGDADAARYARAVELALKDSRTDGVLAILTPQAMTDSSGTADALHALDRRDNKPILASWMGGAGVDAGKGILNAAGIPTFDYPDSAARAFALMWQYSDNLRALYETPVAVEDPAKTVTARAEAQRLLQTVRKTGRTLLTEVESKQLLSTYDIPTVETHFASTEDEAVKCAEAIGFPVVVKLFSETLTHKTDVGGVHLDIRSSKSVRHAWRSIKDSVTERAGPQHFLGVTVQPMVPRDGYELILGSSTDPQFGPVLLFGAGGQLVEVFQDRALGLPPINVTLARRLMEQTRIYQALKGVRGRQSVDLAALEHLLVRFSQLVAEQRWIAEIDINPLLIRYESDTACAHPSPVPRAPSPRGGERDGVRRAASIIALDARVVLHPPDIPEDDLPRLAIRAYPTQYITSWKLPDGTSAIIRPIRPEDEPLMVRFHRTLSERSVYLRYFAPLKLDQRIAHERLSRLCFIDYDREMALVVERTGMKSGEREILGIGRLSKIHASNEAEFALTISDQWQRQGLGTQLLKMLVQVGREEKLERITATILPDNHEMQAVARKAGFTVERLPGASELKARLIL